jgi:CRISPR/Cas system-associated endoribonuclease Cas2
MICAYNVYAFRNAATLQVTHTLQSYDLNFNPVPHGVTVSCKRYTRRFPVRYGSPSDVVFDSGFVHLYTLRFKEKEKRAAIMAKATVHKQGSVQRFTFVGRLEFSVVNGLYKNFTKISSSEFEFLINLIGEKVSKKDTAFWKAIMNLRLSYENHELLYTSSLAV